MSGFSISVQPASRLHPSSSCVSSSEKLVNFMHFHNSCTQKCDYYILLIMTGNAHKKSCHKLSSILVTEQGLYRSKLIVATKWWLLSQLMKKIFNDKPNLPIDAAAFLFIFAVLSS